MKKAFKAVTQRAIEGANWTKFTEPKVARGKTAFPSAPVLQKQLGVRYDYDGEIEKDGVEYHKFNIQPNAGDDIPSTIKQWREENGGTHAIMAKVFVKRDGTKEDVQAALEEAHKDINI